MTIKFLCPYGHKLAVPDDRAGKKGRCPVCNQRVYIPKPDVGELRPSPGPAPLETSAPPPLEAASTPLDVEAVDEADGEADSPDIVAEPEPVAGAAEGATTPAESPPAESPPAESPAEVPIGRVLGWDIEPAQVPENAPLDAPRPLLLPPPPPKPVEEESLPFGSIALPVPAPDSPGGGASAAEPPGPQTAGTGAAPLEDLAEAVEIVDEAEGAAAPPPPGPVVAAPQSLLTGEVPPPDPAEQLPAAIVADDEPLEGYQPDRGKVQTVHLLAVALGALSIFAAAPALKHLNLVEAPGWARLVLVMSALQLLYVVWMVSLPDWSTVWIGMVVFAIAAAIYGMGWAVVAFTPQDRPIGVLGLEDVRRGASGWCLAMLLLTTLMTYCCGRISGKWRKAWELAKAQREQRLPSGA